MPNAIELVLNAKRLPSLPAVFIRVKELMDDPESSVTEIAEALETDPALTGRLLKIANSPFYGFSAQIETVSLAISLIGLRQIHDLVLASSVARAFDGIEPDVIDMHAFWRDSLHCGIVARQLGAQCDVIDGERLFLLGLLRRLGHLVMYQELPRQSQQAAQIAIDDQRPLSEVEHELIGVDYAQVSAELLRAWNLPESLEEPIEMHPEPRRAIYYPLETALLHIANHVTTLAEDDRGVGYDWLSTDPAAWEISGLNRDLVEAVRVRSDAIFVETLESFFPTSGADAAGADRRTEA